MDFAVHRGQGGVRRRRDRGRLLDPFPAAGRDLAPAAVRGPAGSRPRALVRLRRRPRARRLLDQARQLLGLVQPDLPPGVAAVGALRAHDHRPLPGDRLPGRLLHRPLRRPLPQRADRAAGAAVLRQLPGPHLRMGRAARRRRAGQLGARRHRPAQRGDPVHQHPRRGHRRPRLRLSDLHDPAGLRLARTPRPLGDRGRQGPLRHAAADVPARHPAADEAGDPRRRRALLPALGRRLRLRAAARRHRHLHGRQPDPGPVLLRQQLALRRRADRGADALPLGLDGRLPALGGARRARAPRSDGDARVRQAADPARLERARLRVPVHADPRRDPVLVQLDQVADQLRGLLVAVVQRVPQRPDPARVAVHLARDRLPDDARGDRDRHRCWRSASSARGRAGRRARTS